MRKYLSIVFLFPTLLFAQPAANLKVSFDAATVDSCNLKIDNNFIDDYSPNLKAKIVQNHCSFIIALDKQVTAKLFYNKQSMQVFIEPGDAMNITVSKDSLYKSISFSGMGAEQNTFLISFYKEFKDDYDKDLVQNKMLNSTIDAFEIHLFDERKKQKEFFEKQDKSKFSKAFTNYMEQTIRYNYYASLLSFPIVNANQSTSILTVNALPDVMLDGVTSKLVNDDALLCSSYRDFITNYIIYFTSKANGFNKFTDYNISMEKKVMTARAELKGKTLVWYIANFLNSDCDKVAPYTVKQIYGELHDLDKEGTYTQLIKAKCEKRIKTKEVTVKKAKEKKAVADTKDKKNPFGDVALKDINGKAFNPKDIQGKVVFIDFWASWCGPCRQEFPASKLLHERFTAKQLKNIVFLYISIDGNEGNWKNAVEQIGMNGLLLISPGDWSSPIVGYFGINSIPRYMLMDKNGTITNPNAPRPSSDQVIYDEIIKLLEK
jgi:thiol-disulfide isomerase/thioredoxin